MKKLVVRGSLLGTSLSGPDGYLNWRRWSIPQWEKTHDKTICCLLKAFLIGMQETLRDTVLPRPISGELRVMDGKRFVKATA